MNNVTPSPAASAAARRRVPSRAGSSLDTAGYPPSKAVTPSGTTPSDSPSGRACVLGRTVTLAGPAVSTSPGAPGCPLRRGRLGDPPADDEIPGGDGDAGEDEGAVNDPDDGNGSWRDAAMAATATSRPATRIVGIRRVLLRVGSRLAMGPVRGPRCCRRVSRFRDAGDMCRPRSIGACVR